MLCSLLAVCTQSLEIFVHSRPRFRLFSFEGLGGQSISLYKFNDPVPMLLLGFFLSDGFDGQTDSVSQTQTLHCRCYCQSQSHNPWKSSVFKNSVPVLFVCCWFSFLFLGRFQINTENTNCTKDGFPGLSEVYSLAHTNNIGHIIHGNHYNYVQKTRFRFVFSEGLDGQRISLKNTNFARGMTSRICPRYHQPLIQPLSVAKSLEIVIRSRTQFDVVQLISR